MKRWIVVLCVLMFSVGCHCHSCLKPDHPPAPIVKTCSCAVADKDQKIWTWRSGSDACGKAMYDCMRWHQRDASLHDNGCHVIDPLPDN